MACGNLLGNDVISGMSNITLMMIAGIVIQALAECFISPRYLEYFSCKRLRVKKVCILDLAISIPSSLPSSVLVSRVVVDKILSRSCPL